MNDNQLSIRIDSASLSIPLNNGSSVITLKGRLLSTKELHHGAGFPVTQVPWVIAVERFASTSPHTTGYAALKRRDNGYFIDATYCASADSFDRIAHLVGDLSNISRVTVRVLDITATMEGEIIWRQPAAGSAIAEFEVHRDTESAPPA